MTTPEQGLLDTAEQQANEMEDESWDMFDPGMGFLPQLTEEQFNQVGGGMMLPGIDGTSRQMPPVQAEGFRGNIVAEAQTYLGINYVWGGTSRSGVDCSGLIQSVLAKFGVDAPRISYAQARMGPQKELKYLQPGDLVAWDNSSRNNGADHIAFYIGNGQILEAPRAGEKVSIRKLGKNEQAWGVDMAQYYQKRG